MNITISIDAMGGGKTAEIMKALATFSKEFPNARFLVFGNQETIAKFKQPIHEEFCNFIHTQEEIEDQEQPSRSLRKTKSSMYRAIESLKHNASENNLGSADDEADNKLLGDACLSCGNTGSMMVISRKVLGVIEGIRRPAVVAKIPTDSSVKVMLDLGANSECDALTLLHFGLMGHVFARMAFNIESPKVALLNIGTETSKGRELDRQAYKLLMQAPINFIGNLEGNDLMSDKCDVLVSDGFTGNIALKVMEGTASWAKQFFHKVFTSTWYAKIGAFFVRGKLKQMLKKMDPREHNGAMLMGIDGIVVKSHGSADEYAIYCALKQTYVLAEHKIHKEVAKELANFSEMQSSTLLERIKETSAKLLGIKREEHN